MTLRTQTFLALGSMLLATLAVLFGVIQPLLTGTFARLEREEVGAHVERGLNAIVADMNAMESTAQDWAGWDDTYAFAAGLMPSFFDENVSAAVLVNLRVNVLLILDHSKQVHASAAVDFQTGEETSVPAGLVDDLDASLFASPNDEEWAPTSSLLRHDGELMLVASHPVLTSQHEGPARGTLVLVRYLDTMEVQRLAQQVNLILAVRPLDAPEIDPSVLDRLIGNEAEREDIVIHPTSGDSIAGYAALWNREGSPVGILSIETTRDTYLAGQASLRYLGGTAVGTLVLATSLLLLLLDRRVLARMSTLAKGVAGITASGGSSGRVAVSGRDEIAALAIGMNEMLSTLEESRLNLQRSEKQYRDLFEYSRDAIYITSTDGRFIDANQALIDLLRCPREELMKLDASFFYVNPKDREEFKAAIARAGFVVDYPVQLKRYEGTPLECLLSTVAQTDDNDEIVSYQGIIRDVTELRRQQSELAYLATHDGLTGLLNRVALDERLASELARADRNLERCGVLYLDLDHFKDVNDTQGHAAGDDILRQVAQRLVDTLRKSDLVARIGGDEFVILVPGLGGRTHVVDVATKLLDTLREPFLSSGIAFRLSSSIGIAVFPEDGGDVKTLLQHADAAMYSAKQQGRDTWHTYRGSV